MEPRHEFDGSERQTPTSVSLRYNLLIREG